MLGMASLAGQQELGQLQQGRELMGFWGSIHLGSAGAMDVEGASLFQVLSHPENSQTGIHGAGSYSYSPLQAIWGLLLLRREGLKG